MATISPDPVESAVNKAGSADVTETGTGGDSTPAYDTCTEVVARPAKPNGTIALVCIADA